VVLAYSNSVAGKLADYTQQRGMGNIGCFYGGMVAVTLAGLMLFICSRFGDLVVQPMLTIRCMYITSSSTTLLGRHI